MRNLLIPIFFLLSSCAVGPKLPSDVASAVARDDMRVLRTEHIDLYYPDNEPRDRAHAFASRLEGCLTELRKRANATGATGGISGQRLQVIHPNLPFNNAFVSAPAGGDFFSVIPTHTTFDWSTELGIPLGQDYVACHELVHYVQFQQSFRFWGGINRIFGKTLSQQIGLDGWFVEGLATYYEQLLQPGTGRPTWPAWTGAFHAGVAQDGISGGDLSDLNRQYHWGNHYLVGSHFVAYLVYRYGEPKLWELVELQGKSFFFPFIVTRRFKRVYGRTLSELIDDFAADAKQRFPARPKPAAQRTVRPIGANGRYARALDGTEAVITSAMDAPTTLSLYSKNGTLLHSTRLTDVTPPRSLAVADPREISGLSFTEDGRHLYWVSIDQGPVYQAARLMHMEVASGRIRRVHDDLSGLGGSVSPHGAVYYFVRSDARGQSVRALDLQTDEQRTLYVAPPNTQISGPAVSPDGQRIVVSIFEGSYGLAVIDVHTGKRTHTLSIAGTALTSPSFADDGRIVFMAAKDRVFQAFVHELDTGLTTQVTQAPYLAMHARAGLGVVRFFNREGWEYTLDEVPLPARSVGSVGSAGMASPLPVAGLPADSAALPGSAAAGTTSQAGASATSVPNPGSTAELSNGPILPLPAPPSVTLSNATDSPYRAFPDVLIPTMRGPSLSLFAASSSGGGVVRNYPVVGIALLGSDPLGYHRWGLAGALQIGSLRASGAAAYLNAQLAPVFVMISASQLSYEQTLKREVDTDDDGEPDDEQRYRVVTEQREATLSVGVSLRTSYLASAFNVLDDYQSGNDPPTPDRRRLAGPSLLFAHDSLEYTPMSGPRRGFFTSLSGSLFPKKLSTLPFDLTDIAGDLSVYSPLPFSRRHTLSLSLRARALLHDAGNVRLLRVGGVSAYGDSLYSGPEGNDADWFAGVPEARRFSEPLRGYETFSFLTNQIGTAQLRYRYPFIIDAGVASSLGFLPSFFVREIDLELFGVAATTSTKRPEDFARLVAGAALTLSTRFYYVPLSVRYQLSQRFTDDNMLQHVLALGVGL